MMPSTDVLHSVSATAAGFLIASVWQGLVVAAAVAVLFRLMPKLTAAVRSAIWTAVLVLVVGLPAISFGLHHAGGAVATQAGLHVNESWSFALFAAWAALSAFRLGQLAWGAFRLRGLLRRAVPVQAPAAVEGLLRGSARRVQLCTSEEVHRPSVAGFLKPRILISPELLASLSEPELEQVILHELEHLRRRDDWVNLLQKLSLALFPLHPVLLWLDRRMSAERELACDDGVLRQTRARKAYAACLARLAEDSMIRRGFSLALGVLGGRERTSAFAARVHRILRGPETGMSRNSLRFATIALLIGVAGGGAELARAPRLVSFVPAEPSAILASSARLHEADHTPMQLATWHPELHAAGTYTGGAQPTMVKAVMPERAPARMIPATVKRTVRRSGAMQVSPRRKLALLGGDAVVPRQQIDRSGLRLTMVSAHEFQASQIVYAAVPTMDGWLIFQL